MNLHIMFGSGFEDVIAIFSSFSQGSYFSALYY